MAAASAADVDLAVDAAERAYRTLWGLKVPGAQRGRLLAKFADLIEKCGDELAALESLNVGEYQYLIRLLQCHISFAGKTYHNARNYDVKNAVATIRYFSGWADKIYGKTMETTENKMAYTRQEPFGVVVSLFIYISRSVLTKCRRGASCPGMPLWYPPSFLFQKLCP